MSWENISKQAIKVIENAANFARSERLKWQYADLQHKNDKSLLTSIDLGTEERLVAGLKNIFPQAEFLAEESNHDRPKSDAFWIIDPIDGTTNLVHGLPMYCISVGLWADNKLVAGFIFEITSQECFYSWDGLEGAFMNGKRIKVSERKTLSDSLIATGFPTTGFNRLDVYIEILRKLMQETHGIRRLGSAAMDLAYVACGRCDAFYEFNLNPWDVAAGIYLVQKAGGKVSGFSYTEDPLFGKEILATNDLLHKEFQKLVQDKLKEFNLL